MKIREFQDKMRDCLNGVETLVQGGCKAISEDTLDVANAVETQLQQAGGVAIVITTPEFTRNGCAARGIPVDTQLAVKVIEVVALNRADGSHLTALDAAEIVAHTLDSDKCEFQRISQTANERSGTVTATVTFNISISLT